MAVAEHLVGRTEAVGRLEDLLARLDDGSFAAIEVVGEPGIGKTRLLAELAAAADARQHLVLEGAASELEQDLPFWVFVDALDEYLHGVEPGRLERLGDDVRRELAQVFPALSRFGGDGGTAFQHERYRTHRAVRALLELLAEPKPLVLILDDLHWADPATVELLAGLLHRPPTGPVGFALAVRPRQTPRRLAAAIERAHRAGTVERVELEALTQEEARELLAGAAAAAQDTLYEASGGNPFYLEQLARSFDRAAPTAAPGGSVSLGDVDVPESVAAALAEELAVLSPDARRVLEGAAVAGDPFEPELAAAAAGTPESDAIDALDELLALDLVRATDVPRRFRFRHPLVRRAVYESTPGGWRLAAHGRAADALAELGVPPAARAHHVEHAASPGDLAAVAVLRDAGRAVEHRAPASAERWFAAALRVLPGSTPVEERVELLHARSRALAAVGRYTESQAVLVESLAVVPASSVALRVRLTAACASVEHLLGRHDDGHARLEAALAELPDADSAEGVALMVELGVDALYRSEYEAMHDWATRALDATASLDAPALTSSARALLALAAALSGAVPEARARREEAAALDRLEDDELAPRLDALVHLATAEMYLDLFAESGRHAERALRIGRRTGQLDLHRLIVPMLGTALWVQGRMAESAEVFDDAIESARLLGDDNAQGIAWFLFNRSFAALAAGDVDLALETAHESREIGKRLDESMVTGHAAWGLAAALHEVGRSDEAADLLIAETGGLELAVIPGGWRATGLELLTRCLLAAGRRDEAARVAAAAEECGESIGLPMATSMAAVARGELELEDGDGAVAAERARTAAASLEDVGDAYHAALARLLAGRALAQAGDRAEAAAELEAAAAAFDRFGAPRWRAQAERELRKLGRSTYRRSAPGSGLSGLDALTERELELARLVVDRKTNPEIAAELFLSQKTVETHLRNIFRKVGVANRVELARAVEEADRAARAVST